MRIAVVIGGASAKFWLDRAQWLRERQHEVWYLLPADAHPGSDVPPDRIVPCADHGDGGWVDESVVGRLQELGIELVCLPVNTLPSNLERLPDLLAWDTEPQDLVGPPADALDQQFQTQTIRLYRNDLREGRVVCRARTRVHRRSSALTRKEAVRIAPFLLEKAIADVSSGEPWVDEEACTSEGNAHGTPPGGRKSRLSALLSHLAYGAFIEKKWQVSVVDAPRGGSPAQRFRPAREARSLPPVPVPDGYVFLADPFFFERDLILAEALDSRSGKGKIVALENGQVRPIAAPLESHLSYPHSVEEGGRRFVVPEMARGGDPQIFAFDNDALVPERPLSIDSGPLLDPTFVRHGEHLYLFANRAEEGANVLRLWVAEGLFGHFTEHRASPVRVDARGSRMGGGFVSDGDTLYRLGQDFRRSYGDALLCFRVDALDPQAFRETLIDTIALAHVKGPHTLDFRDSRMVFDWYEERFAPLAWARRIAGRIG